MHRNIGDFDLAPRPSSLGEALYGRPTESATAVRPHIALQQPPTHIRIKRCSSDTELLGRLAGSQVFVACDEC